MSDTKKKLFFSISPLAITIILIVLQEYYNFVILEGVTDDKPLFSIIGLLTSLMFLLIHIITDLQENTDSLDTINNLLQNNSDVVELLKEINEEVILLHNEKEPSIGFLHEIETEHIWKFEGKVFGWNPNWALELCTGDDISIGLKKVHLERIKNDNIEKIVYFFLEGYELRNERNQSISNSFFGHEKFLEYLQQITNGDTDLINKACNKYQLYIIPKKEWAKDIIENSESDRSSTISEFNRELNDFIKRFRDFIIIKGFKNGRYSAIVFFNHHWYWADSGHTHYLQIHRDGHKKILRDRIQPFFYKLPTVLEKHNIFPKSLFYNSATESYELQDSNSSDIIAKKKSFYMKAKSFVLDFLKNDSKKN